MTSRRMRRTAGGRKESAAEALAQVALVTSGPDISPSAALRPDPFEKMYDKGHVIEPILKLEALIELPLVCAPLNASIEAYEVNIDGTGHRFECLVTDKDELERIRKAKSAPGEISIDDELILIEEVFDYFNPKESFSSIRRKGRKDMELTGSRYIECVRNRAGVFAGGWHLPSHEMRLLPLDDKPTQVTTKRLRKDWTWKEVIEEVYFRRFVQIRGNRKVYFKEFGDPRNVSRSTGEILPANSRSELATEVIHQCIYSPATPYGMPRFVGAMLAILGSNEADKVNYKFFLSNMIPAMFLLASGATVDVGRIRDELKAMKGRDSMYKLMVIQAIAQGSGEAAVDKSGVPRLDVKPMSQYQPKDMLHQQYLKENRDAIGAAFRLPPIFIGKSQDYNRATADTARRVTEEQVFAPERDDFDFMINQLILPDMGIRYWKFVSNKPKLQDYEEQARILNYLGSHGGITPNILVKFYNAAFNDTVPEIADPWGGKPIQLTLEEMRAQNMLGGGGLGGLALTEKAKDGMAKGMTKLFLDTLLHIRERSVHGDNGGQGRTDADTGDGEA